MMYLEVFDKCKKVLTVNIVNGMLFILFIK